MRDAIKIKEISFQYDGKDCQVTDFWITEFGEVYASLSNNGTTVNINVSTLKKYVKGGVIDINKHIHNSRRSISKS